MNEFIWFFVILWCIFGTIQLLIWVEKYDEPTWRHIVLGGPIGWFVLGCVVLLYFFEKLTEFRK